MQPPPYPPPPPPRSRVPLVVGLAAGALVLLLAAGVAVLVVSQRSSGHPAPRSLKFQQVTAVTQPSCPAGDTTRLSFEGGCYRLGDGMTVSRLKMVELQPPGKLGSRFSVLIDLRPDDAPRLASLTTNLAREQDPRNRLAVVIDGRIASAPTVMEPITGGSLVLSGDFTRAQAERYVELLGG
jgi:SecD-like export protein